MKYGAMNFPIMPVFDELKKIAALGFDYLELTLDPPCAHYTEIMEIEDELIQSLEHNSMGIICHLPTFVYTADLSQGIRKVSLEEMIASLQTAARIGAKKAVLHPSFISGLGSFVMETAMGFAFQSLGAITKEADHLGITLCFENMYPSYLSFFNPNHFEMIFKKFPNLKMTLDTGHANIDDPGKKRLNKFIQRFPDKIGHIHISDNFGKRDDHLAVGQGNIHFEKFIKLLKASGYNDTITLEIFSQAIGDLKKSRDSIALMLKPDA